VSISSTPRHQHRYAAIRNIRFTPTDDSASAFFLSFARTCVSLDCGHIESIAVGPLVMGDPTHRLQDCPGCLATMPTMRSDDPAYRPACLHCGHPLTDSEVPA
jgi:hypothetical protein